MKQRGNQLIVILLLIIALGAIGFLVYQNMQLKKQTAPPAISPTATPVATPAPTPTPSPSLKVGWKLYQNAQYGFEFSYPESYQVLTDKENLYGWPKAILLLYKDSQSYDLAVEIWDSETEYKAKYKDASTFSVFKTKDGRFITLLNQNKDPEVAEIISTFKFTR